MRFPAISFVIPALDAEKTLAATLRSILASDYPSELIDVLVIDNGSTDATASIARELNVRVLREPVRNRSRARNLGIRASRAGLIAFIDADVEIGPSWTREMARAFDAPLISGAQGQIVPTGPSYSGFEDFRYRLSAWRTYGTFNSLRIVSFNTPMINTAACMYRRTALDAVGGFDEELHRHEDVDLSKRLAVTGHHFAAVQTASAHVAWQGHGWSDYLARSFDVGLQRLAFESKWELRASAATRMQAFKKHTLNNVEGLYRERTFFWIEKQLVEMAVEAGRTFSQRQLRPLPLPKAQRRTSLTFFSDRIHVVDGAADRIIELEAYHALPLRTHLGLTDFESCRRQMETLTGTAYTEETHRELLRELVDAGVDFARTA